MSAQPVLTARQIRHRVIGAIVFVSLCIIILPFFLDAEEAAYDPRRLAIEDVPASPFAGPPTAPAPMPAEAVQLLNQGTQMLDPTADPVAPMPDAWGVQAGTVRNQQNARKLAAELEQKGWAQVRVLPRGELHRVIIGPVRAREDAEALLAPLAADFNLKGAVTRFRP